MDNATIRIIPTLVAVVPVLLKHFYAVTRSKEVYLCGRWVYLLQDLRKDSMCIKSCLA